MIKIEIGNSISSVSFIPRQIFSLVHKELSFYDMGIYFRTGRWDRAVSPLMVDNKFPTGLVRRLCFILNNNKFQFKIIDNRIRPKINHLALLQGAYEPTAYIHQNEAVQAFLNSPSGRGIVVLPTGMGKTRVMKDTIQQLGVHTLIIVPSLNIKRQTLIYLSECFGESKVGLFKRNTSNKPISIANLDSLTRATKDDVDQFDCVFFDEWHHEACQTAHDINENIISDIYYKFALTATNFRNSKNEQILLDCIMANELYSMSPVEAMKFGYISKIKYYRQNIQDIKPLIDLDNYGPFGLPENELEELWEKKKDSYKYHELYKLYISENEERNSKVIKQANRLTDKGLSTLTLVKEIAHGQLLQSQIKDCVFVNGQEESTFNYDAIQAFNRGEIKNLVGTSVIGEGVDTKGADCVILANGEKAKTKIMQNIGRVVRLKKGKEFGLVFDYEDTGQKIIKKHSNTRKRIVKKCFNEKAIET